MLFVPYLTRDCPGSRTRLGPTSLCDRERRCRALGWDREPEPEGTGIGGRGGGASRAGWPIPSTDTRPQMWGAWAGCVIPTCSGAALSQEKTDADVFIYKYTY